MPKMMKLKLAVGALVCVCALVLMIVAAIKGLHLAMLAAAVSALVSAWFCPLSDYMDWRDHAQEQRHVAERQAEVRKQTGDTNIMQL